MSNLLRSKNYEEFRNSLRSFVSPAQNFIYADLEGNIGYQTPGRTPIRKNGHTGKFPVHSNGSFAWEGYVPFDELPHAYNPPEGFIASANNRVPPQGFPHMLLNDHDWAVRSVIEVLIVGSC